MSWCESTWIAIFVAALTLVLASSESAIGEDKGAAWFKPFSWQEPQGDDPITSPPPGRFHRSWNPLNWSNETKPTQASGEQATAKALPAEPTTPSVQIQDGPSEGDSTGLLQPGSMVAVRQLPVAPAAAQPIQASHQQGAVDWPADSDS